MKRYLQVKLKNRPANSKISFGEIFIVTTHGDDCYLVCGGKYDGIVLFKSDVQILIDDYKMFDLQKDKEGYFLVRILPATEMLDNAWYYTVQQLTDCVVPVRGAIDNVDPYYKMVAGHGIYNLMKQNCEFEMVNNTTNLLPRDVLSKVVLPDKMQIADYSINDKLMEICFDTYELKSFQKCWIPTDKLFDWRLPALQHFILTSIIESYENSNLIGIGICQYQQACGIIKNIQKNKMSAAYIAARQNIDKLIK